MHDAEHEGEENDDPPWDGETSPALRAVVPRDETMEFEEFGETDERGNVELGVVNGVYNLKIWRQSY